MSVVCYKCYVCNIYIFPLFPRYAVEVRGQTTYEYFNQVKKEKPVEVEPDLHSQRGRGWCFCLRRRRRRKTKASFGACKSHVVHTFQDN